MIYFLKLQQPIGGTHPKGQAQYYVGYCEDHRLTARLKEHRNGTGAKILAHANREGIPYRLLAVCPGDRTKERQIKNRKSTRKFLKSHWGIK